MRSIILTCVYVFTTLSVFAQTAREVDAIKQFCGCFEVDFEYVETFPRVDGYELAKPYTASALEYVELIEETPGKLVLQHLLMIDDSVVIKHWRQDWEYQPKLLFDFLGNETWTSFDANPVSVQGQWSQKVYEVDDTPRYCGVSTWHFTDGRTSWENTSNAPLPRREYTKRSDYQILRRTNHLIIEDWGWTHEQDNEKVVVDGEKTHVIVEEKGKNMYRRTDSAKCAYAAEFWKEQVWFWAHVRSVWNTWLSNRETYSFVKAVDGEKLRNEMRVLLATDYANDAEARAAIVDVLGKYRTVQSGSR